MYSIQTVLLLTMLCLDRVQLLSGNMFLLFIIGRGIGSHSGPTPHRKVMNIALFFYWKSNMLILDQQSISPKKPIDDMMTTRYVLFLFHMCCVELLCLYLIMNVTIYVDFVYILSVES